jgi:hypothetical protein
MNGRHNDAGVTGNEHMSNCESAAIMQRDQQVWRKTSKDTNGFAGGPSGAHCVVEGLPGQLVEAIQHVAGVDFAFQQY